MSLLNLRLNATMTLLPERCAASMSCTNCADDIAGGFSTRMGLPLSTTCSATVPLRCAGAATMIASTLGSAAMLTASVKVAMPGCSILAFSRAESKGSDTATTLASGRRETTDACDVPRLPYPAKPMPRLIVAMPPM